MLLAASEERLPSESLLAPSPRPGGDVTANMSPAEVLPAEVPSLARCGGVHKHVGTPLSLDGLFHGNSH